MSCRVGPLVRFWTMRYEAKHQHFKHLANTIGNFINICHTLAIRHQCYQCYYLNDDEAFQSQPSVGPEGLKHSVHFHTKYKIVYSSKIEFLLDKVSYVPYSSNVLSNFRVI